MEWAPVRDLKGRHTAEAARPAGGEGGVGGAKVFFFLWGVIFMGSRYWVF